MSPEFRGIGGMARASGLSISALRFYDSAGLLRPRVVDQATGYRRYADDQLPRARLIAALRGTGLSLAELRTVLAVCHDPEAAGTLLDRRRRQLETDLAEVRRRLDDADALLGRMAAPAPSTQLTVAVKDLSAALAAVRFAVARDQRLPALTGILLDYDGAELRVVATDRYRLAVATVVLTDAQGPPAAVLTAPDLAVPTGPGHRGDIAVDLGPHGAHVGDTFQPRMHSTFPDYRSRLRLGRRRARAATSALRHRLSTVPTQTLQRSTDNVLYDVAGLTVAHGQVHVLEPWQPNAVAVNRDFLIEALDATAGEEVLVALGGPTDPVAILTNDNGTIRTLTMPARPD